MSNEVRTTAQDGWLNDAARARWRATAVAIAPAVLAAGLFAHPWIGNPGDAGFLDALAHAVATDTTRWALAHLATAVGSGLLILAFLALRTTLREAGDRTWSAVGVPFIVMGSVLFALLPAMEFAPVAAAGAGTDIAATQAALEPWFAPVHLSSAVLFLIGALGFAKGLHDSRILGRGLTWVVVTGLVVMAAARLLPLSWVLLYVGPTAGLVALWPLAYVMWTRPTKQRAGGPQAATT